MLIYFVRHGHPDYKNDCLTELGKRQAAAAAERLRSSGIEKIISSTNGRAVETAEYTARALGLEVDARDFLREISCRRRMVQKRALLPQCDFGKSRGGCPRI